MTAANPNVQPNQPAGPSPNELVETGARYLDTYVPQDVADAQGVVDDARNNASQIMMYDTPQGREYRLGNEVVNPAAAERIIAVANSGLSTWELSDDAYYSGRDIKEAHNYAELMLDVRNRVDLMRQPGESDKELFERVQIDATQRVELHEKIKEYNVLPQAVENFADEWYVPKNAQEVKDLQERLEDLTPDGNGGYRDGNNAYYDGATIDFLKQETETHRFIFTDEEDANHEAIRDAQDEIELHNTVDRRTYDRFNKFRDEYIQRGFDPSDDFLKGFKNWAAASKELSEEFKTLQLQAARRAAASAPTAPLPPLTRREKRAQRAGKMKPRMRSKADIEKLTSSEGRKIDFDENELIFEQLQDVLGRNPYKHEAELIEPLLKNKDMVVVVNRSAPSKAESKANSGDRKGVIRRALGRLTTPRPTGAGIDVFRDPNDPDDNSGNQSTGSSTSRSSSRRRTSSAPRGARHSSGSHR